MLEILDQQISHCEFCNLYKGGRCKPYWTTDYKGYFIIGEAPGKNEVESNEPFIGNAGNHLWNIAEEFGIYKKHCFIINSANCRPVNGNKNGKPSELHRDRCRDWIRKYFKVLQPERVLLLGNYAIHTMTGDWGVNKFYPDKMFTTETIYDINVDVIRSVHPANCIYRGDEGKEKLRKSFKLFMEKGV